MSTRADPKYIERYLLGHGVDFAAIINKQGRVTDYVYRNEINLSEEQKEMFFMMTSLNLSMQKEYDESLGPVQYIVTERMNSKVVSIPFSSGTAMLVMNKEIKSTVFSKKVLEAINYVKKLEIESSKQEVIA